MKHYRQAILSEGGLARLFRISNPPLSGDRLVLWHGDGVLRAAGTVSADGNSGSGTHTTPAGGCTNGDHGTIVGQRLSMLNGMFMGSIGPANSLSTHIVAQLRDDGGKVTGSAVMTNSPCFHSLNITGNVSGYNVLLQGTDDEGAGQTITLRGTFERHNKSLGLTYAVSGGSCSGESGRAQLLSVSNK
jgi:hypothetical protein